MTGAQRAHAERGQVGTHQPGQLLQAAGLGWREHDPGLFHGTEKFFRPGYAANLVNQWLPALDAVTDKLTQGGKVADIGCGHGASTILMAQAFPNSTFTGFDYHRPSIDWVKKSAEHAGVADRVHFEVAKAKGFPGRGYDFVSAFDCLHDMGDPVGASAHVRQALAPDGTWMIVEPFANDKLEDNLNPIGRIFYSASTLICTPASRSQDGALCLGAQPGETRRREVVSQHALPARDADAVQPDLRGPSVSPSNTGSRRCRSPEAATGSLPRACNE